MSVEGSGFEPQRFQVRIPSGKKRCVSWIFLSVGQKKCWLEVPGSNPGGSGFESLGEKKSFVGWKKKFGWEKSCQLEVLGSNPGGSGFESPGEKQRFVGLNFFRRLGKKMSVGGSGFETRRFRVRIPKVPEVPGLNPAGTSV